MTKPGLQFWARFQESRGEIEGLLSSRRMRGAFDLVERNLQGCGYDLAFELAGASGNYFLIFSPEGDPQEAATIDALIADAPVFSQWTVLGRKPRKPMPDPLVFVERIFGLRLDDCRLVLTLAAKCTIDVFSSSFFGLDEDVSNACAATFLFHLLGEEEVMERVDVIRTSTHEAPKNSFVPEDFVAEFDRVVS